MTLHLPPPVAAGTARMRVARKAGRLRLVHGEVLFLPAMNVSEIYLLRRGTLLIFAPSGQRLERWVTAPAVLGLGALLAGAAWGQLGVAQGDVELDWLPAAQVAQRIAAIPDSHHSLLRALADLPRPAAPWAG